MSRRADVVFIVGRAPAPLTCRAIADATGHPTADVARDLTGLVQERKLVRVRSGNSIYHYRLPDAPVTPELPRIHLQPEPLVSSLGVGTYSLPGRPGKPSEYMKYEKPSTFFPEDTLSNTQPCSKCSLSSLVSQSDSSMTLLILERSIARSSSVAIPESNCGAAS